MNIADWKGTARAIRESRENGMDWKDITWGVIAAAALAAAYCIVGLIELGF